MPGTFVPEATRLDRELVKLARDEAELDRQLAIGLAIFCDRKFFWSLSYERATDFMREHLGIQESRARWLARLGRHLRAVSDLDRALAQRLIDASQVIELGRILKEESSAEERRTWIDRASQLSVRDLQKEVRAEVDRRKEAGDAVAEDPPPDPDEPPPGGWISISAPARVGVLWQGTLELARRAAGRQLTQGQAAEIIFAEYLSTFGTDPASEQDSMLSNAIAPSVEEPVESSTVAAPMVAAPAVLRPPPVADDVEPNSSIGEIEDPWQLAEALIRIARQKQRLRFELSGLLTQFADQGHASSLGYEGLERYCLDRLGFGIRRAQRLIRFRAGLDRFPKLAAAYLSGHISYTGVLLLLPVIHRTSERAWVTWASDLTYREIERVTEYARTFTFPDVNPTLLDSWAKKLEAQGLAQRLPDGAGGVAEATAFAADPIAVPPGYALPPVRNGGPPRIVGLPSDLALAPPEHCVARIRFWLPPDALDLAHRALDRCRLSLKNPLTPAWSVFEILLVHFIQTHDTPEARALERRHEIIARDGYRCLTSGCTSMNHLEDHHIEYLGRGGSNCRSNRGTLCFGHHRRGIHRNALRMGGFAPDDLVFMLGIHPKTGRPFACYRNERRVSAEEAARLLDRWRRILREGIVPMALSAN